MVKKIKLAYLCRLVSMATLFTVSISDMVSFVEIDVD